MDQDKVVELFKKEAFVKKVATMENPKDVQAAFKAEGVDLTLDEVNALGKALAAKASGVELSDDDLENVAGGFAITTAAAVTTAVCAAIGVGFSAGDHLFKDGWFRRW